MEVEAFGYVGLDLPKELQELGGSMALETLPNDVASRDVL
jgi:hypothetical protein